jgi:DNA-binding response OmpR family regulator
MKAPRRAGETAPGRILVADDSPNIREILKMSLETAGHTVLVAEDGEQALRLFTAESPDLVILDVMMPKANGFQICRKVKTDVRTALTPVILLTAKSQQEDIYWGKDCGADEYVTKPFSTKELERTVARLLRRRRGEEEASGVAEDQRRRREKGEASQVAHLDWDPRAMDIFRKKYGEFKHGEALRAFQREAERFLKERGDPGPVEVEEALGLSVVLRGAADEALKIARELADHLNGVAGALYADEDRKRGYIPFRSPLQKQEERLPLLSFTPRIAPDIAA